MFDIIEEYERLCESMLPYMITQGGYVITYGIDVLTTLGICSIWSQIYNYIVPDTYFEFISSNGDVINIQYNTCTHILDTYEYVIYTNKRLKSILHYIDAPLIYDGNHITYIQKSIQTIPFFSSILLQHVTQFPYYYYWIEPVSTDQVVELKTDTYNFFIVKNVINTCVLQYILNKHYPNIKLSPTYSIKVLTPTYKYTIYNADCSIVLRDD